MSQNRRKGTNEVIVGLIGILLLVFFSDKSQRCPKTNGNFTIKFSIHGDKNLETVENVFNRFGHEKVNISEDFDVLWSDGNPFKVFPEEMKSLKPHQRVNRFPGMQLLTDKTTMTTNNFYPFIPETFKFPKMIQEFKNFVEMNPDSEFIKKDDKNQVIKMVNKDEIDFVKESDETYQEYIQNLLLIDRHAFDLGIYVLVTSLNPLRIYRYKNEVLLRFCPEPFHPFDFENVNQYVTNATKKTIHDIPSLKSFVNELKMSSKSSLETHLRSKEFNTVKLWEQIDEVIVTMFLENEEKIVKNANGFTNFENFFELVRFDFVIDDKIQVHLLEVENSPEAYEKFIESHEQIVYNALHCAVGIEHKFEFDGKPLSHENIAINEIDCLENSCDETCENPKCSYCYPCLDETLSRLLHRSHSETLRRGGFMRIFPTIYHYDDEYIQELSPENKFLTEWFKGKCEKDNDFC